MPDTPSLRLIEDALEAMAQRIPGLAEEARWLWPLGYERRRGERAGGGMGISKPTEVATGHDVWLCEPDCTKHPKGGERHVASPEWVLRTNVHLAGKRIIEAAAQLARARAALEVAAKAAGRGEDLGSPNEEQLARTVTKGELAKARQMKQWRDAERPKGVARGTY